VRNSFLKLIALGLGFFLGAGALHAQGKHVTDATLEVSTGDEIKVWLNGKSIAEYDPNTYEGDLRQRGYKVFELPAEQLCYFKNSNVLALEFIHNVQRQQGLEADGTVGIAYNLKVSYSDNSQALFSSDQIQQHVSSRVEKDTSEPSGWNAEDFNDGGWERAESARPTSSVAVTLVERGKPLKYLAGYPVSKIGETGDRRLFRRKLQMQVIAPPGCYQARVFPTNTPRGLKPPTATPVFTRTPVPTATPQPPVPTNTPRPRPTLIPTATPRPRVIPPTATPVPIRRVEQRIPTPVPTRYISIPTDTPTPRRRLPVPTPTVQRFVPQPTFTVQPVLVETAPETIVFVAPPVNIFVTFGDGPGQYKLDVVDADGKHLKTLYDKHVGWSRETWVAWDGKNEQGRLMPYGQYFAYFSKDGKVLRRIALTWIAPDR
jgi:hypothetical protein